MFFIRLTFSSDSLCISCSVLPNACSRIHNETILHSSLNKSVVTQELNINQFFWKSPPQNNRYMKLIFNFSDSLCISFISVVAMKTEKHLQQLIRAKNHAALKPDTAKANSSLKCHMEMLINSCT